MAFVQTTMTALGSVTMSHTAQQNDDDLVSMFAQALSFNPALQQKAFVPAVEVLVNHSELQVRPQSAPIYASAHYTQSAHVLQTAAEHTSRTDPASASIILIRHGVDPATLSADQLELFMNAETSQKMRLIQLWRISGVQQPSGAWSSSPESMYNVPGGSTNQDHGISASFHGAEPYMIQGYQQLATAEMQNEATNQQMDGMEYQQKDSYSPYGTAVGVCQGNQNAYRPSIDPAYRSTGRGYCFHSDGDSLML